MALTTRLVGLSFVLLGWSCASVSPPIRVDASPADLEALAGAWWGDYTGKGVNARRGTISFKLVAGERVAHGDVLMIPNGTNRA